jgi:pimeloyl-ACP methyl ester carboxylesterase
LNRPDFTTDHCFYERSGDHDTLMVLFNYWGQPLSARSHARFVANAPCNKLYLHSGADDWFQNGVPGVAESFEHLLAFCQDLKDHMRETRFHFAGHSMGAFAALGCGLFSGADRILASVPEIDLCLPDSMSAKYLNVADLRYATIRPLLFENTTTPIDVIVGRHDAADCRVAHWIAAHRQVSLVELDCGHETFVYLRDQGSLSLVFRAFVEGRALARALGDFSSGIEP